MSAETCRIFTTELYQINSSSLNLVKRAQCHKVKGRSEKSLFCHHYAEKEGNDSDVTICTRKTEKYPF